MKLIFQFPILLLILCSSACGPILYSSIGQNVPMFSKNGQVNMVIGQGTVSDDEVFGWSFDGFAGQVASSFGKNWAAISSFYSVHHRSDNSWHGKGNYFELGIGKYFVKGRLASEIFTGTGWGSIKNASDEDFINANYLKVFIQPSMGYKSRYFEAAFTPRIANVTYNKSYYYITDPGYRADVQSFFKNNKSALVFEPGFTLRLGLNRIKLQLQYCHTSLKYSEEYNPVLNNFWLFGGSVMIGKLN